MLGSLPAGVRLAGPAGGEGFAGNEAHAPVTLRDGFYDGCRVVGLVVVYNANRESIMRILLGQQSFQTSPDVPPLVSGGDDDRDRRRVIERPLIGPDATTARSLPPSTELA